MSTMAILEAVQAFLHEKVTPTIKLQEPNDKNVHEYSLVNPQVHIGWIPPKGYLPEGMESAIPCLIVGLDDGTKGSQDNSFNLRISAAVYSPGLHAPDESGAVAYTPDFEGYRDLLNLIDRTVAKLGENPIINGKGTVEGPIKWGVYQQEQPYPYWYGWITLTIERPSLQATEIVQNLL
ncbi:hypothetical protein [Desulfosporosinus sp. OT]|uniref:hypothetical protein n=1 Tax=Desulfosporosinus sp. OT TaxID=913865 RepID=UPI000223A5D7|nr:hypothetical protein [Desulfosporosinus sp. OT]EGW39164.1 hypothetical protein DOT_2897 [Desulfosporosinus sp. OT]